MCGSCGAMPPWAPEQLKKTSPEARLALERRMEEAQKRFIEHRDAKRATRAAAPEDVTSSESSDEPPANSVSPTEDDTQMSAARHEHQSNSDNPIHEDNAIHHTVQNDRNISELPAARCSEQLDKQLSRLSIRTQSTTELELENEDAEKTASPNVTPLECELNIEYDAHVDIIPLTPIEIPSQPPSNTSHEKNTVTRDFEASQIPQPSRQKQQPFASPVILESPAFAHTTEFDMLPEFSLESRPLSEPLRTIPLRDADSDADSFHTADEEAGPRRSEDNVHGTDERDSEKDIVPIVSDVEWQAFQDDRHDAEPQVASKASDSAGSVSAVSSTDEDVFLEGFTKDMSTSGQPISEAESIGSKPDYNLETSTVTTSSSPRKPMRNNAVEDEVLPADLMQPKEITPDPKPCEDCERWRERVRELEFKVEALTSALTAREMESASMRARAADRRYVGKNATQLMEECESLRMTTEYLVRFHLCHAFLLFPNQKFVNDFFDTSSITSLKGTREKLTGAILLYIRRQFWTPYVTCDSYVSCRTTSAEEV